ncbi:MAG TPA: NAD(P)/FAD-dependent oxidoreductase [Pseudonocardiaceae bacterium]|nr:NAD(P)/FAD-dependent oxidoreductase [Pseudonocardiaceae bacterium]
MSTTRTALVIGGGVAGPVAAMALQKAGIEATVFEAYGGVADGIGGGLGMAANGQRALAVLGAEHAVTGIGTPMTAMVMTSWNGKELAELGDPPGLPGTRFVWRADLYRALYDEAIRRGIRIEHGRRLVSARSTSDSVTAEFDGGTTASADVLIGADGLWSAVRGQIDPAAPQPRYGGLISLGVKVAHTSVPPTGGKMHMVFGKKAFFGYQVEADGTGSWFVNLPHREPMTLAQARAVPRRKWLDALREVVAEDRTPALRMVEETDPAELLIVGPMLDLPSVPAWSRGRMVLVGDAAHAPTSSSGQGASLAIESAVQLARCLRDLPHDEAFAAYEGLRRARVEKIIANGARTNSEKAAGPVARVLRDLLLPMAMKTLAKPEKMAWQFAYEIDWNATVNAAPVPVAS